MKHLLTTLLFALCLGVTAQTNLIPDMKFRRLDTPEGLSSSQINSIFKDSRGFVWIGTPYGLNRYDGYRVKNYYSNRRDTTTMRDNYTDYIYEAADGKLWMRQGMNYCVYDPVTDSFERNAARELAKMGLECNVEWLYIDSHKNFWVKDFEKAIYCFHPNAKRNKVVTIKIGYGAKEFSTSFGISTVAELGDKLLVATYSGELACLNGDKGEVEWVDKWMHETGGIENQEYRLYVDKKGNYWCNVLDRVYIYEVKVKKWHPSLSELLSSKGVKDFPESLQVWDMIIDKNDWLWLACDHDGLVVANLRNGQWKQFLNNKHDETTISDNTLRKVFESDDGSVWIGSYKNGVNQYVPGLSSLKNVELGDVTTVCDDKYGNYWVGTNDIGILVYNPKTDEVVNHFTKDNSGLMNNIIVGSYAAHDGTIWFGSYNGGLSHAIPVAGNPTQATIVNYQAQSGGLANNSVWALHEDKWGRMWISTLGGGLQMLDPKTQKFVTWSTQNTPIPGDYLTSLSWNKKGWLMVGTAYYYSLVNPVSRKLINQVIPQDPESPVSVGSTNYVIEDSRGLIWHGSNVGVIVYDPKTKFQKLIDMTDGLSDSGINSIVEDQKHSVWVVTDHGISRVVPQQQENGTWQFMIRSYNSRDGLQKAIYNQRSAWLTRDGKVLVGGQGGLDIINPNQLRNTKSTERPVFSGLQIFDKDVEVGKEFKGRVILHEALDVCRDITLRFNDQFTIQLATNEVSVNNRKRFAYKVKGFNDDWVKTSEQNPNITFNSLRAGSYTLCVRILKGDGTLSEEESQLEITIRPPLWRTRWMVLLYMLLIAGVAWLWRRRFLKKQEERMELEQLRRETEKKQWMSEMRKQMTRGQKEDESTQEEINAVDMSGDYSDVNRFHMESRDLVPFLKEICDDFKAPEGKYVRLSFFPIASEAEVRFDPEKIRRAFLILLENSVKFSPRDSRIKVFVEKKEDKVFVSISDKGVGISDEAKEYMFEPLVGDDDEINLHIVKDIVTAHGGDIRADDNSGGGTVFTITLPLDDSEIEEAVIIE